MSKIVCDICGTSYPDSAECCPICGCSNTIAEELLRDDLAGEELFENETELFGTYSSQNRKKEIFDFDEVNEPEDTEEYEEEDYDAEEDDEEDLPRRNTFVVIILTVIIVLLLGAAAFIFIKYFLPNKNEQEPVATSVAITETEVPVQTTELTIPCQQMAMTNAGVAELSAEGQQFLLHIKALPENTTDVIIYTSADESIATVTADGKITAVSEGETVIYISCGKTSMECPVIVKYVEETVPPTTEVVVEENLANEETVSEMNVEETEAANDAGLKDVKLKLKRTDIQLGVYYSFQLELDCDLEPEDVTWTSEHSHIATVDAQGNVTAVKAGTTSITAKYGDQEVQCMVRCIWY